MMGWPTLLLSFVLLLSSTPLLKNAAAMDASLTEFNCTGSSGYYANQSAYKSNLDTLLDNISNTTNIQNGFYTISVGDAPNQVTGIALCRGDVSVDNCHDCLKTAVDDQTGGEANCPAGVKEILAVYEYCMLGYSNRWKKDTIIKTPMITARSPNGVPSGLEDKFNTTRGVLLHELRDEASNSSGSGTKYALGYKNVTSFMFLYALVQCTPDLNRSYCQNCLDTAIQLASTFGGVSGGRVFYPSCNLRYEINPFYTPAAPVRSLRVYNCGGNNSSAAFKTNLSKLLTDMVNETTTSAQFNHGFYNLSVGQQVDGIALCRGDVNVTDCQDCVKEAANEIPQLCPVQEVAIGWYDTCMLRYSSKRILNGIEDKTPISPPVCGVNAVSSDLKEKFNATLTQLLHRLRVEAVSSSTLLHPKYYASGYKNIISSFNTLYALVQCTPDLSNDSCNDCLDDAIQQVPVNCPGVNGGRVLYPSCNLRYEYGSTPFYYQQQRVSTPTDQGSSINPPPTKKVNWRIIIIVACAVVSSMLIIIILTVFILQRRRRTAVRRRLTLESDDDFDDNAAIQFTLETIVDATADFSIDNKLGAGGYGVVYKGVLSNGQEIAVKRLDKHSSQGEIEFKNEVMLLAKLQHRNLVRLVGFCLENKERLLVYEFIPNSSLDKWLFNKGNQTTKLDWQTRYKIIVGIARGLLYLHEDSWLRIIHRDLKASNILLDAEMSPKIADFGMARLCQLDQTQSYTSRLVGTFGYMAPEYLLHGQISVKSDVYSFGVLILEILTGHRNCAGVDEDNSRTLLSQMWSLWAEGRALSLVDSTILLHDSRTQIMRCIHIGLLCVQENVSVRPTMSSVILMLSSQSITLPAPYHLPYLHDGATNPPPKEEIDDINIVTDVSLTLDR